jgi:hypothetical protein
MTLAEQLVLFALDPVRGKPAAGIVPARLRRGTAAAILAELVLHHRLRGDPERGVVADALPDYNPLLGEATELLREGGAPVPIDEATLRVERGIAKLERRVIDSLVARDLLHHYRQAFFWHRHPLRSRQAFDEVAATLRAASEGGKLDLAELAFAAIADGAGLAALRLGPAPHERLRQRLDGEIRGDVVEAEQLRLIRAIARTAERSD